MVTWREEEEREEAERGRGMVSKRGEEENKRKMGEGKPTISTQIGEKGKGEGEKN